MEDSMCGYGPKLRAMKTSLNSIRWIIIGMDGKRRFPEKSFHTRAAAEVFADRYKGIYAFKKISHD